MNMAGRGRPRKRDSHLPKRVYLRRGAYYFVDYAEKWHKLGRDLPTMYRRLADYLDEYPIRTMNDVFDRYAVEVIPQKAPRTQKDNRTELKLLRGIWQDGSATHRAETWVCLLQRTKSHKPNESLQGDGAALTCFHQSN
jgi:hypothetical protein